VPAEDLIIEPLDYTPPAPAKSPRRRPSTPQLLIAAALLSGVLLAAFLLGSRSVELILTPAATRIEVSGGISLRLGSRLLLRPGEYRLQLSAPGYHSIESLLQVGDGSGQRVELTLEKLPGRLRVSTLPVTAQVFMDGSALGQSNGEALPAAAGSRILRVEAQRFLPAEITLDVIGMEQEQQVELTLAPGWGSYRVESMPAGAVVLLDDVELGRTPADLELLAGTHHLRLRLAGYRDEVIALDAVAGEQRSLPRLEMQRADAVLSIESRPSAASITLDGVFQGRTPMELALDSSKAHELIAFKAGHERVTRRLEPGFQQREMRIDLPALQGEVRIKVNPTDAEVMLGNRVIGRGVQTLTLPAQPQTLRVRRAGFVDEERQVTPRPGFPQDISITLRTREQQQTQAIGTRLRTSLGAEMVLLQPGPFTMGSSRREPGRRANESLREVRMQRPFHLGVAEVSNGEFRKFRPGHSSGNFKGKSLNGDEQPAANISWEDAALFCNWLSERESLPAFYRVEKGRVIGFDPRSRGYRLPAEAEWAWAATLDASGNAMRYGWGPALPPPAKAGNFADQSGATLLGEVIPGYDDGHLVAAPVRQFTPNRHGLFDMSGNVAEWMHDHYEALPAAGGSVSDPMGPDIGEFHVIRGSSWRHGSITELRLAFRDYGKEARADLGFRLARYAK
jgi:formylglycine-generating enzyme required for sulfatase activity